MSRPLIGLNCKYHFNEKAQEEIYTANSSYLKSIARAGAIPVVLPLFSNIEECRTTLDRLDGLVLTGGSDIHPKHWRERKHSKAELLHPKKEASDFILASEALKRDMPVLGICYGCQLTNVILGGSLHQHLPDLEGMNRPHARLDEGHHPVRIVRKSRTKEIMGVRDAKVNSFHHQAIKTPGKGLDITAVADDGVVEGTESSKHRFLVNVQWHPERHPTERAHQRLFEALISEAKK